MSVDSVSWTCRDCGGTFVGDRPPDLVCGQCLAARLRKACAEVSRDGG